MTDAHAVNPHRDADLNFRSPAHGRLRAALLRRLGRWLHIKILYVFRRPLGKAPSGDLGTAPGYAFAPITADDLLRIAADPVFQLSPERIRLAQRQSDLFFGVFHQGRLIAYRWYALSGETPCEDSLAIRYTHPGRAYGYRTFTHPAHRGRHLHRYSTARSDAELTKRGCTHTIGYIAADNLASLRANSRLAGAEHVGTIVALRILGRPLVLRSRGAVRQGVSLVAAA